MGLETFGSQIDGIVSRRTKSEINRHAIGPTLTPLVQAVSSIAHAHPAGNAILGELNMAYDSDVVSKWNP
jgi:hypothetical protein